MKRWRVVHFPTPEQAESYLNGLSIEPDQIKGIFANPPTAQSDGGVLLVCWLSAHQQRVEQLQQQPRGDDDLVPPAADGDVAVERLPRARRRVPAQDPESGAPSRD